MEIWVLFPNLTWDSQQWRLFLYVVVFYRQQQILSLRRVSTTTHVHCHWWTDVRDVTCKPSTCLKKKTYWFKYQALAALSQFVDYMYELCCQRLVFKPRSCFFWTITWFTSLSRDWRVCTNTHHRYHWSTDDKVVRVHSPAWRYWESRLDIYYIF